MRLNILYSILTQGAPASVEWDKATSVIGLSDRGKQLVSIFLSQVAGEGSDSNIRQIACVLCYYVRYSRFGAEISKLDPYNTYSDPAKLPDAQEIFSMLPCGPKLEELVRPMLDIDIRNDMYAATWVDLMGGICLQLLREVL